MPESFESMLEELAEAAIRATAPPGVEAARRRARERVVQRRVAISVLVLVLVGGSGGAWATAAHERQESERTVAAAGEASASASTTASATPSRSPSAQPSAAGPSESFGATAYASGTGPSIWKTDPMSDGYLLVFSDGVVALSTPGGFPLCYGRLKASGVDTSALSSAAVPLGKQPLADVSCDDFGVTSGLTLVPEKAGGVLQVAVPPSSGNSGYAQTYTRQDTYQVSTATSSPMAYLPSGTWKSADGKGRTLVIGGDGSVAFTAFVNSGKQYTGVGSVDAVYPSGARALIDCGTPASTASGGGAGAATATPCGVLLIEQDAQTSDEITVYGSYGPEMFIRTG